MEDYLLIIGAIFVLIVGYIIGRWFDKNWRCNTLRRLLRKPYIVLNVVGKDERIIDSHVVNSEGGVVRVGTQLWVLTKGRIYDSRDVMVDKDGELKVLDGKKQYVLTRKEVKLVGGAPNVFLDSESITALDFYRDVSNVVKPEEVGASLIGWLNTEMTRMMALFNKMGWVQFVSIGLIALTLVFVLIQSQDVSALKKDLAEIKAGILTPSGGKIVNGTLVITQPGTATGTTK